MPYFGLFSFLPGYKHPSGFNSLLFQCPTSGFSLFYNMQDQELVNKFSNVSMPYFGLFSFLPFQAQKNTAIESRSFNALLRAFLFSTLWLYNP